MTETDHAEEVLKGMLILSPMGRPWHPHTSQGFIGQDRLEHLKQGTCGVSHQGGGREQIGAGCVHPTLACLLACCSPPTVPPYLLGSFDPCLDGVVIGASTNLSNKLGHKLGQEPGSSRPHDVE